MDASAFSDLLKPFPLLQLFIGGTVFLAILAATLRGSKENKREAHIAPAGHDPLGFNVFANSILVQLSLIAERIGKMEPILHDLHTEGVKTNARLAELKDSHAQEMDHLRDTIKEIAPD